MIMFYIMFCLDCAIILFLACFLGCLCYMVNHGKKRFGDGTIADLNVTLVTKRQRQKVTKENKNGLDDRNTIMARSSITNRYEYRSMGRNN